MSCGHSNVRERLRRPCCPAFIARRLRVRALVRDLKKAEAWTQRGVEIHQGELNDAVSIAKALKGVTGVYVLVPPILSQSEIFIETKTIIARVLDAWPLASPLRLVALSLIAPQQNREPELIIGTHVLEEALCDLSMPTMFVHAGALHDN